MPPLPATARGQRAPKGVLRRLLRTLFEFYPVLLPVTLVCILINAIVSSVPSIFMQNIIAIVDDSYQSGRLGCCVRPDLRLGGASWWSCMSSA